MTKSSIRRRKRRAVLAGDWAELPFEGAVAGDDVDRGAAGDPADVEARVGRVEAALGLRRSPAFGREPADLGDDLGRRGDRVDAAFGRARMRLVPGDPRAQELDALMRVGDLHLGRLADDRQPRTRRMPLGRPRISAGTPRQPTSSS